MFDDQSRRFYMPFPSSPPLLPSPLQLYALQVVEYF